MFNFNNICNIMSLIILATMIFQGRGISEISFCVVILGFFMAVYALLGKAEREGGLKAF